MSKEMITNTLLKLFSLENKVILATGAAGAIGSEIAKLLSSEINGHPKSAAASAPA